jgi:hypothetical protein
VALFAGPASVDKAKRWDIMAPVVGVAAARDPCPAAHILLIAVPRALPSTGRVRNAGVTLLELLVAAVAFGVGVLLAVLAGSSAGRVGGPTPTSSSRRTPGSEPAGAHG